MRIYRSHDESEAAEKRGIGEKEVIVGEQGDTPSEVSR